MREKHGYYKTRLYVAWTNMKNRCYGNSVKCRKNYGERGITVCDEWNNSFISFKKWALNNGYTDELTLDRIDVNGNYEPKNCRWITNKEQQNNRQYNVLIGYKGQVKTLAEWSSVLGINYKTLQKRISKWGVEEAFNRPVLPQNDGGKTRKPRSIPIIQFSIKGEYLKRWDSIREMSRNTGYKEPSVISCCKHRCNTAYGYIWKYESEVANVNSSD